MQKQEFASCKIFEGLFTDVAVSESGYLGFYRPSVPSMGRKLPEQPEYYELLHVSQINDIDIDADEDLKVSSGLGGAIVGGLIGGGTGAVIGSAATGGKAKNIINEIDLIVNTKDFQNPRRIIPLYKGLFTGDQSVTQINAPPSYIKLVPKKFAFTSSPLYKSPYNSGKPPIDRITELTSAIHQIMAAHADQQAAQAAAPQLSTADELLKFKQLLDAGVITQDEFDAKKRQLLG